MTHIEEITEGLMDVFRALRSGTMEAKDAAEINNTAGKITRAYATQLAYFGLRNEVPEIPGLGTTATPGAIEIKPAA